MKDFGELIDGMNDAQLGAHMRDRLFKLCDAHHLGLADEHPVAAYNRDSKVLRAHRAITAGNVGEAKEIEPNDRPVGDDPSKVAGAAPLPERDGTPLAATDSAAALEELRIRQRCSPTMDGDLLVARARRINPTKVTAMSASIPGYGRIR